jgi:uncharacterized protein (UPF0371 family)
VNDLTRVQGLDTLAARAIADSIKREIEAVYRAAGFHYPATIDRDNADGRVARIEIVLEELGLTAEDLTAITKQATDLQNITESRETVIRAWAIRAGKKRNKRC